MKYQLIFFVLLAIVTISPALAQETSSVFLNKSVSQTEIEWSDEITVKVLVFGVGDKQISDIKVADAIPFGFKLVSNDGIKTENEFVVFQIDSMQPGEQKEFSYKIKPIDGIKGEKSVDTNLPRASATYVIEGITHNKESNAVQITIEQSENWWEENTVAAVTLLITLAFGFGTLGTEIHNQNSNFGKKKDQKPVEKQKQGQGQQVLTSQGTPVKKEDTKKDKPATDNENTTYPRLIGGVAGVIVLASFEGLSSLFANGQLQPTVQNMVVLIATCLAAGFTPIAVIDKMTSKFKAEAKSAKDEKEVVEELKTKVEKENEEIETENKKIETQNKELKKKEKEKTEGRDATLKSNKQLELDNKALEDAFLQLKTENDELKNKLGQLKPKKGKK
ncbi:hypothetical protein [Nitrosopumilus sp.]|uniref:hypothetical protein n=1 Tax=Nitrosopumilus sp. TaxID=2024843 RepID=UPI003D1398FA